jgi:hypothetical protein
VVGVPLPDAPDDAMRYRVVIMLLVDVRRDKVEDATRCGSTKPQAPGGTSSQQQCLGSLPRIEKHQRGAPGAAASPAIRKQTQDPVTALAQTHRPGSSSCLHRHKWILQRTVLMVC